MHKPPGYLGVHRRGQADRDRAHLVPMAEPWPDAALLPGWYGRPLHFPDTMQLPVLSAEMRESQKQGC